MNSVKIGPHTLATGAGLIYSIERNSHRGSLPDLIARPGDSLVAFERLFDPDSAEQIRTRLDGTTRIASLLSAWHFDPPEDHPEGPDYVWVDALINDFRGINDELDTVEGVQGEHFTRLLEWQPKVDREKTALIGLIGSERYGGGFGSEGCAAAGLLAEAFSAHGYDALIVAAYNDHEKEAEDVVRFAEALSDNSPLPLLIVSDVEARNPLFCMQLQWRTGAFWK